MDIVQEVLRREQENLAKFKPITVEKHLEVENDLGLLLCSDPNDLDENLLRLAYAMACRNIIFANISLVSGPTQRNIYWHSLGTIHSYS